MCYSGAEIKTTKHFLCVRFLVSERRNIHYGLYLKDPSVISFDKESLLNALLYALLTLNFPYPAKRNRPAVLFSF